MQIRVLLSYSSTASCFLPLLSSSFFLLHAYFPFHGAPLMWELGLSVFEEREESVFYVVENDTRGSTCINVRQWFSEDISISKITGD